MSNPEKGNEEEEAKKNPLGLSATTYGLGSSIWAGIVSTAAIGVAFFATLQWGKHLPKVGSVIEKCSKFLLGLANYAGEIHFGISPLISLIKREKVHLPTFSLPEKGDTLAANVVAAFSVGTISSHLFQIPFFAMGVKKVKDATKKYEAVVAENAALKESLSHQVPDEKVSAFIKTLASNPKTPMSHATASNDQVLQK